LLLGCAGHVTQLVACRNVHPTPATHFELDPAALFAALRAARAGGPDDLTRIKGVGPKLAALLQAMGYHHFDQIAGWTAAEAAWIDANLEGVRGRATRDDWVGQARILAASAGTRPQQG
jgi:NADH-quinone oxidoreductase subunit E